jgi:peptidoglycan-associated lipoprotein
MTRRVDPCRLMLIAGGLALVLTGCASHPTTGAGVEGATPSAGLAQGSAQGAGASAEAETAAAASPGVRAPGAVLFPALPSPKDFQEVGALRDVHFDFDRAALRPEDARILDANARWLAAHPGTLILIEGHADARGTNEYNLALGESRARVTRDQLVARGITSSRITLVSYGEERPLCRETTEGCWAQNRRAHFLVKPPSMGADSRPDQTAGRYASAQSASTPPVQR